MTKSILGEIGPADFLDRFWQKRPLLIRGALPGYQSPISPDELAGLALEDSIESRIVLERGSQGPWEVRTGPFDEETFAALPESRWTLLVQAVDLWVPPVKALLSRFDFLPPWRLDDIMVSYAAPGGSVGPHFDYYDVFLLQVQGSRRWQIGAMCDARTPLLADCSLRIIKEFEPEAEWVLEPGDMLYLPPRVSHWGVAETECLTYSIGFRSPTLAEMLGDLATELMAQGDDHYYRDPALTPAMATESIDTAFVEQARGLLKAALDDPSMLEDWFARYMTAPKYPGLEAETEETRRAAINGKRYLNGERSDDPE